ncbi:MAG: DUF6940 family protein [Planctomycetota bacterium]
MHFGIQLQGRPLTRKEAFQLWATDDGFRDFQTSLIADAPMQCLRWETPGIQSSGLENPFEFVLLDSPYLDVPASPIDFQEHFRQAEGRDVLRFPNLGGDALMVVPTPRPQIPINAYAHLAAFARSAPREQQHALWKEIGAMMLEQVGDTPLWLSTAGGGVDWLHVRLDTRPKYYGYEPYRSG